MDIEQVARVCHEANRAFCQSLGDNSQASWSEAPQWQRDSCINGVQFRLDNPFAQPEASHENWMAEKLAQGWRKGNRKDPHAKIHPCLVPFNELPLEQQVKDYIFVSIVEAFRYAERPRPILQNLEDQMRDTTDALTPTPAMVAEKLVASMRQGQQVDACNTLTESESSDGNGIGGTTGAADRSGETSAATTESAGIERGEIGRKTRRSR